MPRRDPAIAVAISHKTTCPPTAYRQHQQQDERRGNDQIAQELFVFEEWSEPFAGALMPVVTRPATCLGGSCSCPMPRPAGQGMGRRVRLYMLFW